MSHTVPDWDRHGGELDAIVATTDFLAPVNGKLDPGEVHAQWMGNDGHVSTGGRGGGRGRNPHWQPNCPNEWSSGGPGGGHGESEDGVTPSKPRSASPDNKGDDDSSRITVPVVDNTMALNPHDEMIMWLHQGPDEPPPRFDVSSVYALDETLEKSYCSPFFGELPDSNMSNLQSIRDSVAGQSPPGGRSSRNHPLLLPPNTQTNNASLNRAASADAALAMGAGRAAGVLPHQTGVEAFNKVRTMSTTQQPFISGKSWSSPYGNPNNSNHVGKTSRSPGTAGAGAAGSVPRTSLAAPPPAAVLPPPMLPPRSQPISLQPVVQTGPSNFSYFSRPAALMKANLQCLGVSQGAGVGANRLKIPARAFDGTTSSGSSIAESTTTRQQSGGAGAGGASGKGIDVPVDGGSEGGQQQSLGTESSWPSSMQNSLSSKDAEAADHVDSGAETRNNSGGGVTSPAAKTPGATDKYVSPGEGVQDAPEPTLTSSSGGSGYSADRGKGVASTGKRRAREPEESECQSDDAEEEVIELKKPQQRGGTAKRTRAAEVHNLSERRRRDRINERMKALQELIPNSNKTDKASMLDEAIEYLKMLQIQLQMMSMRSGMSIPPLIPAGLQHLQMPQMGPMGPMGMGMGMGPMVGMGMGMLDMNSMAAGRPSHLMPHPSHGGTSHSGSPMMPHPSHGGASYSVSQMMHHPPLGGPLYNVSPMMPHPSHGGSQHSVSATSPAVPMVDSHDLHLQSSSALESVYLARQHPLQLTAQNMDVYNAYMMHQQHQHQHSQHHQQQHHHQQQQQPQQLLQQPQQQHQPNHMPNMGSGGPPQ